MASSSEKSPPKIPAAAVTVQYSRSSGPGGQNVNKVSSKVQLRVDLRLVGLEESERLRVAAKLAGRLDAEGLLLVESQRTRDQARNFEDALEKAAALIAKACAVPRPRRKTRPSRSKIEQRLTEKRRQSEKKQRRKGGWHSE